MLADFNDLHTLHAVRLQLETARRRAAGSGVAGLPATSPPDPDPAAAANPSHAHPGESAEGSDEEVSPAQARFGTYSVAEKDHFAACSTRSATAGWKPSMAT